jgi:hypothetical protein
VPSLENIVRVPCTLLVILTPAKGQAEGVFLKVTWQQHNACAEIVLKKLLDI